MCTTSSKQNHGRCHYCQRDVSEYFGCYFIMQTMDRAITGANFDSNHCVSCWEVNKDKVLLDVLIVNLQRHRRQVVFGCPVCNSSYSKDIRLNKPPPKKET